jgi:hypothetical protein
MFLLRIYLWVAPNILLLVALFWMWRRSLQRQHPFFATYLALQLACFLGGFIADFLVSRSLAPRATYLWMVIVAVGLSAVTEMAVLYELAAAIVSSRSPAARPLRAFLRWTAGILVLLSVVVSALLSRSNGERLMGTFQALDVSVNFLAMGLLLAIIVFTTVLNVSWRGLPAGIALGFGISAAAEIAGSALLSAFGRKGYISIDLIRMTAFHICALIWLIYVFLPEKQKSGTSSIALTELEAQIQDLQRMVQR